MVSVDLLKQWWVYSRNSIEDLRTSLQILWANLSQPFFFFIMLHPCLSNTDVYPWTVLCNYTVDSVFNVLFPHAMYRVWCWSVSTEFPTVDCNLPHHISDHYLCAFAAPKNPLGTPWTPWKATVGSFSFLFNQRRSRQSNIIQCSQSDAAHMCHKLGK